MAELLFVVIASRICIIQQIYEYLPKGFQMLLLASPVKLADCDVRGLMALPMPFKVQDLMSTLEIMLSQYY